MATSNLPEFELLMKFSGVSTELMIENHGQRIHDEYMDLYGSVGALTFGVHLVRPDYDVRLHFAGPEESADWLETQIQAAAQSEGGSATTLVLELARDIGHLFESSKATS